MARATVAIKVRLLEPSASKATMLRTTGANYRDAVNLCREAIEYWDGFREEPRTKGNLQKVCYETLRSKFHLPAQLAIDALTDAWAGRKDDCARVREVAASFNVPRSGNLGETDRGNPVIRVRTESVRLALPIERDGAWDRLKAHLDDDWSTTHFRVSVDEAGNWSASFVLTKDVLTFPSDGMVGVDVGSSALAAVSSVGNDERVGRQFYFGQDIAVVQQHILHRRAKLFAKADKGSRRARRSLDKLKGYERNHTRTRCYQVAHQVADLAGSKNQSIAIEDLNHLRDSRLNRAANRIVKRLPYHEFRAALGTVAAKSGIPVVVVPARNTSRTCPRCDHVAKQNRHGRSFRCVKCGFAANADRNASVNIAVKALSAERLEAAMLQTSLSEEGQLSADGGRVNGPVRNHDGGLDSCPRHVQPPEFKPPTSVGGS